MDSEVTPPADGMQDEPHSTGASGQPIKMVLFCLIRRKAYEDQTARFLLINKQGYWAFPPTKFRPGEDLYHALIRPMESDLGLPPGSYYPEQELDPIFNVMESPRVYTGLPHAYQLYPVVVSLTDEALAKLDERADEYKWWHIGEVGEEANDLNIVKLAHHIKEQYPTLLTEVPDRPTMNAIACRWAAMNEGGVRIVRAGDITRILGAGDHAFNLRVADPYLPYHRQGFGFTWSFFTPRDKQDLHVHGLPAVEIYGVMAGRLQIWHKPMSQRGVRTWRSQTLGAGDWAEVEPLHCHCAFWLEREGMGMVVKAAHAGELANVGRLGVAGKTTCDEKCDPQKVCNMKGQCVLPENMKWLLREYAKPFAARNYEMIAAKALEGEAQEAAG